MVGKYDGFNDNPARISCIFHWWFFFWINLTGGFKKTLELTWITGIVLVVLTSSFDVTGYSWPCDQIDYWPVKTVTYVPETIPIMRSPLIELLRENASIKLTLFLIK